MVTSLVLMGLILLASIPIFWKIAVPNSGYVYRVFVDRNGHGVHVFTESSDVGGDGPGARNVHHVFVRLSDGKRFRRTVGSYSGETARGSLAPAWGENFATLWKNQRYLATLAELRARTRLDLALEPSDVTEDGPIPLAGHRLELVSSEDKDKHHLVCHRPDGTVAWKRVL